MQSRIEQAVGAILVQQNRWERASRSVSALRDTGLLNPQRLANAETCQVADLISGSGLVNTKAPALIALGRWFREHETTAETLNSHALRGQLRELPLIGPESADAILLYSYHRSVFIADAYARRLLRVRGFLVPRGYEATSRAIALAFSRAEFDITESAELHGLIVEHGKRGHLRREELREQDPESEILRELSSPS